MDRGEIVRLTSRYGGVWLVSHAERLLKLIALIGEGLAYDTEAMWIAAYLHDWGASPKWARQGVSHCLRSQELASAYLRRARCPAETTGRVLEAIRFHHGGADGRSSEAVLLSDADALDSLGVLGVLKEFAMIPAAPKGDYCLPTAYGMREACELNKIRRENNTRMLKLERSRQLAARRLTEMDRLYAVLEEESFGCL
ncbi:MAG: HD domain-containing protein [Acidobacteria bacterium]|nr:HD domain-containing protein [Acidobacteriota bacterium]